MKKFLLTIFTVGAFANLASAQCNELFFSEYVEGTFNNKALEIFNPTANTITLTGNYRIVRWSNGSTTSSSNIDYVQPLTGTIESGGTFTAFLDKRVTTATGADTILFADLLAKADSLKNLGRGEFYSPVYAVSVQGSKCLPFNGDDAISLDKNVAGNWVKVDIFGKIGEQPTDGNGVTGSGAWTDTPPYNDGIGLYISKNKTLFRKGSIQQGVTVNPALFNALGEWDSTQVNYFKNLGYHDCVCTVGLNENSKSNGISVFPNPSAGLNEINIVSSESIVNVLLLDEIGRTVWTNNTTNFDKKCIIPTKNLAKGIYTASIKLKSGKQSNSKIVIQ